MSTYLWKSCSFCSPRVPFVNCGQFMYLVISLLVLRAGYGIWLYQFLIIAYLFTSSNGFQMSVSYTQLNIAKHRCHLNTKICLELHWPSLIVCILKSCQERFTPQRTSILSKNKKYPGNSFHAWVNRGENTLLLNACLATLTIWLCRMAVHFGVLRKCWNKGCFKHKKGSFFVFTDNNPWKLQKLNARKSV